MNIENSLLQNKAIDESSVSLTESIKKLFTRAWIFAEDGDWEESATYFNKVLDAEPTYIPAYLGLLCVDLKSHSESNLSNIDDPNNITNHKYYKRVTADPDIKSRIDGYIQTINSRIDVEKKAADLKADRKRVQDDYDSVCQLMRKAKTPDEYNKVIKSFNNIDHSNYQDIGDLIKEAVSNCERESRKIVVDVNMMLSPFREKFKLREKAEKRRKLQEQQNADLERLNDENNKSKAETEAARLQLQQEYNTKHSDWQEECRSLKLKYDRDYKDWELEFDAIRVQANNRKIQDLCPHCGGRLKGLFSKKCRDCGQEPSTPVKVPFAPTQPNYPTEPQSPKMPKYKQKKLALQRHKHLILRLL